MTPPMAVRRMLRMLWIAVELIGNSVLEVESSTGTGSGRNVNEAVAGATVQLPFRPFSPLSARPIGSTSCVRFPIGVLQ